MPALAQGTARIPRATLQFGILSGLLGRAGGVAAYYFAPAIITTLGNLSRVAPAAGAGGSVLSQLSQKDASIFQRAAELGASASNEFMTNLAHLADATFQLVPNGSVRIIGQIGNSPVYGSVVSRVGIAEVNGVTMVVKMTHGNAQVLGPLP